MYCPKCGREIDESSQYCKYCGAHLEEDAVESAPEHPRGYGEDISAYETPRMIPMDMMEKNERIVFETHASKMGSFFNHIVVALLLLAGGSAMLIVLSWEIPGAILMVIGAIIGLVGYVRWRSVVYALTTNRIVVLKGIFSKELYENRLDKVQDIRMKISLRQRIYNCGDIFVSTAGTSGVECIWENIPDPRKKQKLLRTLMAR
ncbi:MAG: PH domain-containing protein [Dehalococcoidia bacterium]